MYGGTSLQLTTLARDNNWTNCEVRFPKHTSARNTQVEAHPSRRHMSKENRILAAPDSRTGSLVQYIATTGRDTERAGRTQRHINQRKPLPNNGNQGQVTAFNKQSTKHYCI